MILNNKLNSSINSSYKKPSKYSKCSDGICENVEINKDIKSDNIELNMADLLMNEVFNNVSSSHQHHQPQNKVELPIIQHIIEDDVDVETPVIKVEKKEVKDEIFDLKKDEEEDKHSIMSSNKDTLTKKNLSKLNVEKLKEKCVELNISSDGSKNQLIEKILSV